MSELGTWIPRLLQENMISAGCKLHHVFIVSAVYSFEKNKCDFYASNAYISKQLGVCDRRVRQIVTELVELGWLIRNLKASSRGSERNLLTTALTKKAINFLLEVEVNDLPPRKKISSNNTVNNKDNNKDLTATSKRQVFSDEAIRCLISKDTGIDKNDDVFDYYDAAHQWAKLRSNVIIDRNPNTTIISSLKAEYYLFDSIRSFVYFLDSRWIERNVENRDKPVNLSWLILLNCEDEMMRDSILSVEGEWEFTKKSVNTLIDELELD